MRMPMIAMTTNNSTRVKPRRDFEETNVISVSFKAVGTIKWKISTRQTKERAQRQVAKETVNGTPLRVERKRF